MKHSSIILFGVGIAIGGAVTALCTPYRGRRARRLLNNKASEVSEAVKERVSEAVAAGRSAARAVPSLRRVAV